MDCHENVMFVREEFPGTHSSRFFRAKNFKILMDFLKTKRIFARGVQNVLGINEMPLC